MSLFDDVPLDDVQDCLDLVTHVLRWCSEKQLDPQIAVSGLAAILIQMMADAPCPDEKITDTFSAFGEKALERRKEGNIGKWR